MLNLFLPWLFLTAGLGQLGLLNGFTWPLALAWIVWTGLFVTAQHLLKRHLPAANPWLLPLVGLLSGWGLLMVGRLAPRFLPRQTAWLVVAMAAFLALTLLPRNLAWLRRYKYTWLILGLGLLATTLIFGVNPSGFGQRLWLGLGGVYFQPSEPLKLLLVIFLAVYLSDQRRQMMEVSLKLGPLQLPHPAYFGPMLLMWGFSIVLLFWQGDLGAAFLFFATFLAMLYIAVADWRYTLFGFLLLLAAGFLGYFAFDYVALRVQAWWNPWLDSAGRSFQIVQSLLAFANGGWWGQGLGQGLPTAIPVVHSDFVFAAIAEEYGLIGALALLLTFAIIVWLALDIALSARTHFQQLLAVGIGFMLGFQTLVIVAGSLKLIPLTGVTLPFVSYGGSSLLTSFAMMGLLLFVSARAKAAATPALEPAPSFVSSGEIQ